MTIVSSPFISLMQWVTHAGWRGVSFMTESSFLRQSSRIFFHLSASAARRLSMRFFAVLSCSAIASLSTFNPASVAQVRPMSQG